MTDAEYAEAASHLSQVAAFASNFARLEEMAEYITKQRKVTSPDDNETFLKLDRAANLVAATVAWKSTVDELLREHEKEAKP